MVSLVGCHQTWIYSNLSKKGAINFSKIDAYITYWVLSIKQPVSENIGMRNMQELFFGWVGRTICVPHVFITFKRTKYRITSLQGKEKLTNFFLLQNKKINWLKCLIHQNVYQQLKCSFWKLLLVQSGTQVISFG